MSRSANLFRPLDDCTTAPTAGDASTVGEHVNEHVWPERADDGNDVAQHELVRPVLERVVGISREAEVVCARIEELRAVHTSRGKRFLRSHGAQRRADLGAENVLSRFAARERQVPRLDTAAAREPRDERRVLVIGMRAEHEHARRNPESVHEKVQLRRAAFLRAKSTRSGGE